MNRAVAIIAIIIILVVGGLALAKNDNNKTSTSNTSSSGQSQTTPANDNSQSSTPQTEATITYDNNGFSPSTLTVKSGATITIKNTSSTTVDLESDPHPQHTNNPELNAGPVASGASKSFIVTTKGTWGYHNHLNPGDTGTIVVQ